MLFVLPFAFCLLPARSIHNLHVTGDLIPQNGTLLKPLLYTCQASFCRYPEMMSLKPNAFFPVLKLRRRKRELTEEMRSVADVMEKARKHLLHLYQIDFSEWNTSSLLRATRGIFLQA
jgi:hypothetical protein